MLLKLKSSHLSIKEFPDIEIPPFTLITGLNGTGKTHLLKGIKSGNLAIDNPPVHTNDIRYFDWNNLIPQDKGIFDSRNLDQQRADAFRKLQEQVSARSEPIVDAARQSGITGTLLADPITLARLSYESPHQLTNVPMVSEIAAAAIQVATETVSKSALKHIDPPAKDWLIAASTALGRPAATLGYGEFVEAGIQAWGTTDLFQQSFGELFVEYRNLRLRHYLKQLQRDKGESVEALTDAEFETKHGIPPWDFVNRTLASAGLDFQIDHPDEHDLSSYQPQLTKLSTGVTILFNDLSSGEKVLMSFALCLYYSQDKRQLASYPKILLLDEVDAPLHPSMSRGLLDAITNVLVADYGISVLATTHSPSTVALAPEDAIHVMRPGEPGLHKTSKGEALNTLTEGVPTLALSYDGRRQVFVESPVDAVFYDSINQILKNRLGSERSLEFISTGKTIPGKGDVNTGCSMVIELVGRLHGAGNSSVFGLIDWDGENEPAERISVLAYKKRNGLENLALDPLLVACAVVRDAPTHMSDLRPPEGLTYPKLLNLPRDQLQPLVTSVVQIVMGTKPGRLVTVEYLGGFNLQVGSNYLLYDDHCLYCKVLKAFPALKAHAKRGGDLVKHVAATVLREQPEFVPLDLFDILHELLEARSH
jgi:AAA domain, putative AbiEii toxin, Type IV TA system